MALRAGRLLPLTPHLTQASYSQARITKASHKQFTTGDAVILKLTVPNNSEGYLNPSLIMAGLQKAKSHAATLSKPITNSVLITTGADESKYYSRGFDICHQGMKESEEDYKSRMQAMIDEFKEVVKELISYPMPTIAAINGYAHGAGLLLALSHDYLTTQRVPETMENHLQLQHLSHLKMSLQPYLASLIRSKVGSPWWQRRLVLEDKPLNPSDFVKMGLVNAEHTNGEKAWEAAKKLGNELAKRELDGDLYAALRKNLYPELCVVLGLSCETILPKYRL